MAQAKAKDKAVGMSPTALDKADKIGLDEARTAWDCQTSAIGWFNWIAIGKGLQICQRLAFGRCHPNDIKSQAYRKAMAVILEAEKLDGIDKGDRSVLSKMMEQLPAINAWRGTLTQTERLRYNHPRTVMARFKRATTLPQPKSADGAAVAPAPRGFKAAFLAADAAHQDAKARITALERTIESGGGLFNVRTDQDADRFAQSLVDSLEEQHAERIARGILVMVRMAREPQPNQPMPSLKEKSDASRSANGGAR